MEKRVSKNAKPMLMIKALLLAYAATGILLLILAFLLYKMGLGESQINIGIMVTYIVSCLFGGFYKDKSQTVCMGYGSRYGICRSSYGSYLSDSASDKRRF